ncbi:predicted protein [Chaetoceros tenuissimus]|uniref:Uncharacterized protein n=1 Tax=Chaetoceros tenuissimus TaxID=426638 RepID=A0AAD3D486_9STRA|nr:predicted protein [Chaetoceros tenuissimus]
MHSIFSSISYSSLCVLVLLCANSLVEIEAATKQQDEKRYPNIEMNLINDLDECLVKTGDMFAGQEHKSMFTSPYFKNLFPQAISIENHKLTLNIPGYYDHVPLDTSGDSPLYIGRTSFQQTCSEIGGMTQTINLHMQCKWYSHDDSGVEDLVVDFDSAPICISKWCDTNMLRKQLSTIFAKGFELHFNQQVESQNASCKITTDACISETKQLQNLHVKSYKLQNVYGRSETVPIMDALQEAFACGDSIQGCLSIKHQQTCEGRGGQVIEHKVKVMYTDSEAMTTAIVFKIRNYPHCISRLCNLGRDKEDLEELFTSTVTAKMKTEYAGDFYKNSFSLSVEIDDEVQY